MASLPTHEGAPARAARRPTLRDVAARAGVSFKTVSRVVNDEPGVSPTMAARVRAAAADLGYRPNAMATALRRADGRTSSFGVLLEDTGNPFFAALLRGIEDTARDSGVAVLSSSTDLDVKRERETADAFAARQVDAVIAAPSELGDSHLERLRESGVRVVLVDRPGAELDAPCVLTDNRAGARTGVEHLLHAGHQRIGFVGRDPSIYTARERFEGYVEALSARGLTVDPALVFRVGATRTSAIEQVAALLDLDEPPTALFTAQDIITMTAVGALQARGLADEVALVGFDDFELAGLLRPGITVVAQDPYRMGVIAAELALGRTPDAEVTADQRYVVPTQLVARGSGEIAPV